MSSFPPLQCSLELLSRAVKAGVHRPHRDAQELRDRVARHLVELEHHEESSLLDAHEIEHIVKPLPLPSRIDRFIRSVIGRRTVGKVGGGQLPANPGAAPVGRRHPEADAIEPSGRLGGVFEGAELPAYHHEHFLHEVLEIGIAHL